MVLAVRIRSEEQLLQERDDGAGKELISTVGKGLSVRDGVGRERQQLDEAEWGRDWRQCAKAGGLACWR
jgi:hypothetical protein